MGGISQWLFQVQTLNKKKIELFKRKRSPWRDLHVLFLARGIKTPGERSVVGMDVSSSIFHTDLCQAIKPGFMRLHARLKALRGLEFTRWLTACRFSRTPRKTLQTFDLSCVRSHLLCWAFYGANAYFSAGAFYFWLLSRCARLSSLSNFVSSTNI